MPPSSTSSPPATPLHATAVPADAPTHLHLAVAGARLITPPTPGLEVNGLTRSQVELARLLTVERAGKRPLHRRVAMELPRRSGKTTTVLGVAFGRCAAWPRYQVTYVAQTGIKSRERFYDVLKALTDEHGPGAGLTGWRARESRGEERLEFVNGSVLRFLPPKPDSFRSDAADLVVIDEAQEHDPEDGAELLGAAKPVMDTRPLAQMIVAGTAGEDRGRLLWDVLERGRRGEWAILEYAAGEHDDPADEATWWRCHPGLADGLTTIESIRENREDLGAEQFGREYLGLWPADVTGDAFSQELWDSRGAEYATRPLKVGLAFDVAPGGSSASIAAAWRDGDGRARVELIDTRPGALWVDQAVLGLASGRRGAVVGYDASSMGTLDVADRIARARRAPKLEGLTVARYAAACAGMTAEVLADRLRHARQPELTEAVRVAKRSPKGDAGWVFGRRRSGGEGGGDISPLVAAAVALKVYDDLPRARSTAVRTAS